MIVGALQAGLVAQLLDAEYGDLPVHLPLHPLQPDQGVELGQQLVDAALRFLRLGSLPASVPRALSAELLGWERQWRRHRHRGAGARARPAGTADSWAAAATEAFPMTRIVGSPSSQAAEATSASAPA